MTLAADAHEETAPTVRLPVAGQPSGLAAHDQQPIEFWPTSAIRLAIESGDLTVWQRIVAALKRDPYGRTSRQVEEVLDTTSSPGISTAMTEVLSRARKVLENEERAEVSRQVQQLLDRSGLGHREFASRIGVTAEDLTFYLEGTVSPSAVRMIRMQRLAERFAKMRAQRTQP